MNNKLKEGINFTQSIIVEIKDTAKHWGSGNLEVFATPAMVGLMENTALKCIAQYINEGEDTVGIEINTKHIKATKVGEKVTCTATISKVEGKKIFFEIIAEDEDATIGLSKHIRYIIETEKFISKLG